LLGDASISVIKTASYYRSYEIFLLFEFSFVIFIINQTAQKFVVFYRSLYF